MDVIDIAALWTQFFMPYKVMAINVSLPVAHDTMSKIYDNEKFLLHYAQALQSTQLGIHTQ